ncbi:MAG: tRNA (adenosine(37)-N6)-threonylcarbamoyltransferase complex dimerization subunit type 1 TsaB [Steroidobacteraceae bacterium]
MKILAFDSATELCSAALLVNEHLLVREEETGRTHAARILPMIDELLRESRLGLAELDALAFGRGPGGFTGVRLATSIAQGLALGASRPVVPVSDLQALAERAFALDAAATHALVCNDARMHEVYWAVYGRCDAGGSQLLGEERVGPPASVALPAVVLAAAAGVTRVTGAGRGFQIYPALRERLGAHLSGLQETLLPRAAEMARIGAREWRAGRAVAAAEALPVYLREDVAKPVA